MAEQPDYLSNDDCHPLGRREAEALRTDVLFIYLHGAHTVLAHSTPKLTLIDFSGPAVNVSVDV